MPSMNDFHRPAIRGQNGVTERLVVFIQQKQALSLCGDADTDNLFPANAGMGKQGANDSHAALPQFCHIALCPAWLRA